MKKVLIVGVLIFLTSVAVALAEEIPINKTINTENWELKILSVENTGKDQWDGLSGIGFGKSITSVKDKENSCFWLLTLEARYKQPVTEKLMFKPKWVEISYQKKGENTSNDGKLIGVIFANNLAIFGELILSNEKRSDISFKNPFFFIAPRKSEQVASMHVGFLDRPKIQILPLVSSASQEVIGPEKSIPSTIQIEVDAKVSDLVNSWDKKICFFTSKENPLRSLQGLKKEEIAAWGMELFKNVQDFCNLVGIPGEGVRIIGTGNPIFSGMKNPPRLFITWSSLESDLKDSVRIEFIGRKSK